MKTLQTITQSSSLSCGITPSSTASATAFATAAWAGPKILPVSSMFFIVTLGTMSVCGFGGRFGRMTASSGVCPAERFESPLAKAVPIGPFLSPIRRSTWAISVPSPIRASPIRYVCWFCWVIFSNSGFLSSTSEKSTSNSLIHWYRVSLWIPSISAVPFIVGLVDRFPRDFLIFLSSFLAAASKLMNSSFVSGFFPSYSDTISRSVSGVCWSGIKMCRMGVCFVL